MLSVYNFAILAAAQTGNPLGEYWSKMTDPARNPFRGLYSMNGFDLLIVLPYFAVLTILAAYGLHRYWLVYSYVKFRKNLPPAPPDPQEWPRVTVQLPIYNERYVIERLIEAVVRFDYPPEKLEIQVLDDSTDETQQVARACVERHQALGANIRYLHRDNREGYKAGALAEGLKAASGEFIAIFDADFLPPADFLRRTVPYFSGAGCTCSPPRTDVNDAGRIGMVQTRWTYLNRHYSKLTEVESILLDGHFVIEHGARARSGCFFNFNGTAGVWRRAAIEDAGGWEHDTLTEDTDLSYRAQLRGWRFRYLPQIECPSELPVEMNGFKAQQARWAKGLVQTARKILPKVLRADLPGAIKVEAVFHLTAGISYPLMIVLATMLLPAMIVRFYQGWFQMLLIDLPLFLASSCSISGFYLASQRVLYPKGWTRTVLYLPFIMAVGIGLSVRNAKAVLEALSGKKSEFARTPKFSIEGQSGTFIKKTYKNRAGWMPWIEIGLGIYFAATIVYAIQNENYLTVPFLFLFVWGYLYTGLMSLGQAHFERLRADLGGSTPLEEVRPAPTGAPGF